MSKSVIDIKQKPYKGKPCVLYTKSGKRLYVASYSDSMLSSSFFEEEPCVGWLPAAKSKGPLPFMSVNVSAPPKKNAWKKIKSFFCKRCKVKRLFDSLWFSKG